MRLNFVIPGFSKCGTTTLCSLLNEHPDIFIPDCKEPCFFAQKWNLGWPQYERLFTPAQPHQLCGEGSTFYSTEEFADIACQRMLDRFPDLKFLFIARHPITRIESSFREMHHSGHKYGVMADHAIGDALRNLPNILADTMYWARISTFRQYVPDERIHTLFLEDFKVNALTELRRCFEFLGVDTEFTPEQRSRKLNPASEKLYDSRLFRYIQQTSGLRAGWRVLPESVQNGLTKVLRLRRPFEGPVQWDSQTLDWVMHELREDSIAYLNWAHKPADYWNFETPQFVPNRAA